MKFCVVGINHHIAPIKLRENVHFKETDIIQSSDQLLSSGIDELVILSTCNRSEIYFMSDKASSHILQIKEFYKSYFDVEIPNNYFIVEENSAAIRHLFNVAIGLDSVAVGEDQILGQIIDAQETSMNLGCGGKGINKVFREAITFAKAVKTHTEVSHTPISIAYIGVKKLEEYVVLKNCKALVIGLGNIGRLAVNHLIESGADVYASNRTLDNSIKMQREFPALNILPFENLRENIELVDVVVSATASPHIIIKDYHVENIKKPLFILDLSLPRDVSTSVTKNENIKLFDIDNLRLISQESLKKRRKILESFRDKIEEKICELEQWELNKKIDPIMKSLNERSEEVANDTLDYIFRKTNLTNSEQKKVDKIVRSALKKVVREPILSLNEMEDVNKKASIINILEEVFIK